MKISFIADDYGENSETNSAIAATCSFGLVRSISVLASKGCVYGQIDRFDPNMSWGAHFYLTEHVPLTNQLKQCYGKLDINKRELLKIILTGKLSSDVIFIEFEQQLIRLIDEGFPITFLDTHQNIHTIPNVYKAVKAVALKYNLIENIRPIYQLGFNGKLNIRVLFSWLCSEYLRLDPKVRVMIGCPGYSEIDIDLDAEILAWDYALDRLKLLNLKVIYVPCHPGMSPSEVKLYSSNKFQKLLAHHGVHIV